MLTKLEPGKWYILPEEPHNAWPHNSGGKVFCILPNTQVVRFEEEGIGWFGGEPSDYPDQTCRYWSIAGDLDEELEGIRPYGRMIIKGNELCMETTDD